MIYVAMKMFAGKVDAFSNLDRSKGARQCARNCTSRGKLNEIISETLRNIKYVHVCVRLCKNAVMLKQICDGYDR